MKLICNFSLNLLLRIMAITFCILLYICNLSAFAEGAVGSFSNGSGSSDNKKLPREYIDSNSNRTADNSANKIKIYEAGNEQKNIVPGGVGFVTINSPEESEQNIQIPIGVLNQGNGSEEKTYNPNSIETINKELEESAKSSENSNNKNNKYFLYSMIPIFAMTGFLAAKNLKSLNKSEISLNLNSFSESTKTQNDDPFGNILSFSKNDINL